MADRFFIGPYDKDSGLTTNYKPWAIAESAFSELNNAYVFRGRVRKRFGTKWFAETSLASRFRQYVGTTDAGGNLAGTIDTTTYSGAVGQMFSGSISLPSGIAQVYTVTTPGAAVMLNTGPGASTFNTGTGVFTFNGVTPLDDIYFYPNLPVMGLQTFDITNDNSTFLVGFDTAAAYQYLVGFGWNRLNFVVQSGAATWTGSDSQFFWTYTWLGTTPDQRYLFVTNFNQNEPNYMRFLDASTFNWNNWRPIIAVAAGPVNTYINSARIVIPFKNRLLLFNTWEGTDVPLTNINYPNRCRFSTYQSGLFNGWRTDIPGQGGYIDAPTSEGIITVEFIKDRLIVFFERSTWELVYTGNQALPFVWQQINTELGSESTFSIVPFDKIVLGIGNVGIHACNGANVERIDTKIPQQVFDIHFIDNGLQRVYGIRDYYTEMVYWTFPDTSADTQFPYPDKVLTYNYQTGTWGMNDDSITCFGYWQQPTSITWDSVVTNWDDPVPWNSGALAAKFRQVVAGNQEGYTFIVDSDVPTNASVMQITQLTVVNNVVTVFAWQHNLPDDSYIYLDTIVDTVGNLTLLNQTIQQVSMIIDNNTFSFDYDGVALAGTYRGGGTIARVSNISIKTKEYNFYANKGRNCYVSKVDFLVDQTDMGSLQVDYFVSSALDPLLEDSAGTGALVGTGTLDTFAYTAANGAKAPIQFEDTAQRLWHPLYLQADGEFIQLQLTMNDTQMRNTDIRLCDFQLHAIVISATPTAMRFQ